MSPTGLASVKDYWNRRPCNIRHSTKEVGTREYFNEVEARKFFVEPHIPGFANYEKWRGGRVLEIGCGLGTDTINFARAGAKVTAVDLSAKSLELARKRAEVFELGNRIQFFEANAEMLHEFIRPEPYDLIYSFGVLHHTEHPENAFDQLAKYSRPGTQLRLMLYNRFSWKVLWIVMKYGKGRFWRWKELVKYYSEAQEGCPYTFVYSRREMREIAESRGFRVDRIFADHIFPYRIPDYVQYRYVKVWYFRWMPHLLFRAFERLLGWHLCLEATYEGPK